MGSSRHSRLVAIIVAIGHWDALVRAQGETNSFLIASNWQKYPGYTGNVEATKFEGYVKVEQGDTPDQVKLSGRLTGLPNGTFGIDFHSGFDVGDKDTVGGHFYPGLPWNSRVYTGPSWLIESPILIDGIALEKVRGRTMVVHDSQDRVGIATLLPYDGVSLQLQAARIRPFAHVNHLSAQLREYPDADSSVKGNWTLSPESRVWVVSRDGGGLTVHYHLKGLVSHETSGGAHIHEGTSCSSHAEVSGHFLNSDGQDPWDTEWTKSAGQTEASGQFDVEDDKTLGVNDAHAFVIHQHDGRRVACGLLRSAAKATILEAAGSGVGTVWVSDLGDAEGTLRVSYELAGIPDGLSSGEISVNAGKECTAPQGKFWNDADANAVDWSAQRWMRATNMSAGPAQGFVDVDIGYSLADIADHAIVISGASGVIGCGLLEYYPKVTGFAHVMVDGESVRLQGNLAGLSASPCMSAFGRACNVSLGDAESCSVRGGVRYGEASMPDAGHQRLVTPAGGLTAEGEEGMSGGGTVDAMISAPEVADAPVGNMVLVLAANEQLLGCGEVEVIPVQLTVDEVVELKEEGEKEDDYDTEDEDEDTAEDDIVLPEDPANSGDLINVVVVYGSFSLVLILIFSAIRTRYDALYNPRNTYDDLKCDLAQDMFGWDWAPKVLKISEDDIFEHCGFDGVSLIRWLRLGLKVALVACFNAIWLMPVYYTSPVREINANITDGLERLSMANVYANDPRMYGSVLAAYINTIVTIVLVYKEFHWYIKERHRYLARQTPQTYSILVGGVPPSLRSKLNLSKYFTSVLGDSVLEVQFALHIKEIESLVAEREATLAKLDHANAVLESKGERPHHMTLRGKVDSIEAHQTHADALKEEINSKIAEVEQKEEQIELEAEADGDVSRSHSDHQGLMGEDLAEAPKFLRDAAFVSFKTLKSTTSALQLLHHRTPFNLWAVQAPLPKDIYWGNIGAPHVRIQLTSIVAGVLTVVTCVLWTIPVSFVATLTKVEELKKEIAFLKTASDNFGFFDELLGLVAPVALIIVTNLLPAILTKFCQMEGHVGEDMLQASLFSKLTFFMIVQVFFVSVIAGSIFNKINQLIEEPSQAITILAKSLPPQAITFMGYTLVKATVELALELIRFWPWFYAGVRHLAGMVTGTNLTEDERAQGWWGFEPLSNPGNLDFATVLSDMILIFIVLYVYSVLAPVAAFVMAFGFFMMGLVFKYQMIYVYDPSCDTGGKLWPQVAGYVMVCLIISQVTIMGVIGLKSGAYTGPLMIPLVAITILFWRYLNQQHFRVALMLPMQLCLKNDSEYESDGPLDYQFVLGAYRQEALSKIEDEGAAAANLPASEAEDDCRPDGQAPATLRDEARAEHPTEPVGTDEVPLEVLEGQARRDSDAPARPPSPPPPRQRQEGAARDASEEGGDGEGGRSAEEGASSDEERQRSRAMSVEEPESPLGGAQHASAHDDAGDPPDAFGSTVEAAQHGGAGGVQQAAAASGWASFEEEAPSQAEAGREQLDGAALAPKRAPPPPPPKKEPPPPPPRPGQQPPPSPPPASSSSAEEGGSAEEGAASNPFSQPQAPAASLEGQHGHGAEHMAPMEADQSVVGGQEQSSLVRRLHENEKGVTGESLFFD